jgi:CRP-like cAMP-binding protein
MKNQTICQIKSSVVEILLDYAKDGSARHPRLTQLAMAEMIGTSREMIGAVLMSLQDEGIIRLEHLRIVIDEESLHKVVGQSGDQLNKGG